MATRVCIEVGSKKVFASALDWPGWARSGRTEEAALATLAEYAARYSPVVSLAGLKLPKTATTFTVVERLKGNASTDFGIPAMTAQADRERLTASEAKRRASLVTAAWAYFDQVAAASPAELRKGPRGGGRDRDKIIDHVLGAEVAYAHKIGIKERQPAIDDVAAIEALREKIAAVLAAPSDGEPLRPNGWTARYAASRFAWHVLDHAWEMQDRAEP
ncbi:MAG TPA: hypothetical protein VK028_15895 [Micromonosporaceae bacterium]|nr:hypothetical protein [Micromonosporaceae bacterium]